MKVSELIEKLQAFDPEMEIEGTDKLHVTAPLFGKDVQSITKTKVKGFLRSTRRAKCLADKRPIPVVARAFRVTEDYVRQLRESQ